MSPSSRAPRDPSPRAPRLAPISHAEIPGLSTARTRAHGTLCPLLSHVYREFCSFEVVACSLESISSREGGSSIHSARNAYRTITSRFQINGHKCSGPSFSLSRCRLFHASRMPFELFAPIYQGAVSPTLALRPPMEPPLTQVRPSVRLTH